MQNDRKLKVAVAGFLHETNTFAPNPADLAAFEVGGGYVPMTRGPALWEAFAEVNLGLSGALRVACTEDWEVVPVLWAGAIPSAHVTRDAYEHISAEIIEGIVAVGPLDGIFLDLHGAMVAEHLDDGEGELLRRLRAAVGHDVPVVAALDLHGNISREFVDLVDVAVGFRTYPHVDMAETGAEAARQLATILLNGTKPAKAFRQMSYLVPIPFQSTQMAPAKALYEDLAQAAGPGVRTASLFTGFPAADIPDCGPVAMAFAETAAEAEAEADRIAAAYETAAEGFLTHQSFTPAEAMVEARLRLEGPGAKTRGGPVIIADTQDNPGAGGISATTGLLRAMVDAGMTRAAIGLIVDPESAAAAHAAGEGAELFLALGGRPLMPGDAPFEVTARVAQLSDGRLRATGPYYGGTHLDLGPSARLRIDGIDVVVTSRIAQMADREMFRFVGITPEEMDLLVVKSSTHFRADFAPIARDILVACAPGPMPLQPADLPFTRLRPDLRLSPQGPTFGDMRAPAARLEGGGTTALVQNEKKTELQQGN